MSYYKALGLEREPFSTSPDPDFFYDSSEHHKALMRLMIEVRLRRGLSLILGDVGVGKTTLLRKILQMFAQRSDIISTVIFDPTYEDEQTFLGDLIDHFRIDFDRSDAKLIEYREAIKNFLFQKGIEEKKTIVLLVDEAQKLTTSSLETLRGLLNYETNEYKLFQLVLLSQLEILPKLKSMSNLLDRINFKCLINPLSEEETRDLIDFRLQRAGSKEGVRLFSPEALKEIYQISAGYPRKITMLCHQALKEMVMYPEREIGKSLIQELVLKESKILNVR